MSKMENMKKILGISEYPWSSDEDDENGNVPTSIPPKKSLIEANHSEDNIPGSGMLGLSSVPEPSSMPGPSGMPGPIGIPGPSGMLGPSGMPGPSGTPGPSGMVGPSGIPGPSGMPGTSATPEPSATPGPSAMPGPNLTLGLSASPGPIVSPGPSISPGPIAMPGPRAVPVSSSMIGPSTMFPGKQTLCELLGLSLEARLKSPAELGITGPSPFSTTAQAILARQALQDSRRQAKTSTQVTYTTQPTQPTQSTQSTPSIQTESTSEATPATTSSVALRKEQAKRDRDMFWCLVDRNNRPTPYSPRSRWIESMSGLRSTNNNSDGNANEQTRSHSNPEVHGVLAFKNLTRRLNNLQYLDRVKPAHSSDLSTKNNRPHRTHTCCKRLPCRHSASVHRTVKSRQQRYRWRCPISDMMGSTNSSIAEDVPIASSSDPNRNRSYVVHPADTTNNSPFQNRRFFEGLNVENNSASNASPVIRVDEEYVIEPSPAPRRRRSSNQPLVYPNVPRTEPQRPTNTTENEENLLYDDDNPMPSTSRRSIHSIFFPGGQFPRAPGGIPAAQTQNNMIENEDQSLDDSQDTDIVMFDGGKNNNETEVEPDRARSVEDAPGSNESVPKQENATVNTKSQSQAKQEATKKKSDSNNGVAFTVKDFNLSLLRLLECPVCMEWMEPPMWQCRRGHLVCARCRARLNSCPVCRTTFSSVRNRAMEGVADLLRYPCRHGCGREVRLRRRTPHEHNCAARKYQCPAAACATRAPLHHSQLEQHFQSKHLQMMKIGSKHKFTVKVYTEQHESWFICALEQFFHLRIDVDMRAWGVYVYVAFIGPKRDANNYSYQVSVDGSKNHDSRKISYSRNTHSDLEGTTLNANRQDCFQLTQSQAASFIKFKTRHNDADKYLDLTVEVVKGESTKEDSDS